MENNQQNQYLQQIWLNNLNTHRTTTWKKDKKAIKKRVIKIGHPKIFVKIKITKNHKKEKLKLKTISSKAQLNNTLIYFQF